MTSTGVKPVSRAERGVPVPAHDGVSLATDVIRPEDDVRHPCLLQRVPYDRSHPRIINNAIDVNAAVGRGYVVVTQDCRGRFDSEGTFRPFLDEADDGVATVGWIVSQPWSDGTVGLIGRSYSAMNQWLLAARQVPAVKAMAPFLSGPDPAADWFGVGRSFEWGFAILWGLRYLLPDIVARADDPILGMDELVAELDAIDGTLWEPDPDLLARVGELLPAVEEWLDTSRRDDSMRALSGLGAQPGEIDVPAFVIGGWFDLFLDGCLDAFDRLPQKSRRLLVGPWPHGGMSAGVFPEQAFGLRSSGDAVGITDLQLDWFDLWLGTESSANGDTPTSRTFVMGANRWRDDEVWPPTDSHALILHPHLDEGVEGVEGSLTDEVPADGRAELFYDEDDPVPTRGGTTFLPGLEVAANAGPRDQRETPWRTDVLTFVTRPLPDPLEVTGRVGLHIVLTEALPSMRVVARLVDVEPEGRWMLVAEGAGPVSESLERGGVADVDVTVGATSWRFASGHRVALLISHTSHPRFRRSVDDGQPLGRTGRTVVLTGKGTRLTLPVVGGDSTSAGL